MKRWLFGIMSVAMIVATTGCLAVEANHNKIGMAKDNREVVTVNDHVYLVNKVTGKVWRLDLSKAEIYHRPAHASETTEATSTN